MRASCGDDLRSNTISRQYYCANNNICVHLQPIRDHTDAFLGCLRSGRFGQLRAGRHQDLHALLGHADVWHVLGHQYRCAAEPADRHDESLVPADLRAGGRRVEVCEISSVDQLL